MSLTNKRVFLTGATGFIGANLMKFLLNDGAIVFALKRNFSNTWRINEIEQYVTVYSSELRDSQRLEQILKSAAPHVVIHTAAYGGYSFENDFSQMLTTNMLGTLSLLNACKSLDLELFINTGSSSEYGIKSGPMKESDLLEPNTEYGFSKAAATLYCHAMIDRFNIPITTLRPFSPFGYFEEKSRLIPSLILASLKRETLPLSSPTSVRDFIFIEDVIEAYKSTIENRNRVVGEVINIGSGIAHTVGDVVEIMKRLSGNSLRPEWGKLDNPRCEPLCWQADIGKAKSILQWQPKHDLKAGLEKSYNWFKANVEIYDRM